MVTLATWNVENLFSPGANPDLPVSPADYAAKLDGIAAVIAGADADVVALQEVGDDRALADLVDRLGAGWSSVLSSHPDRRGIRVAVVARLPLRGVVAVVALPPLLAGAGWRTAGRC